MLAEHINPFITALVNTFDTMLNCEAKRGPLQLKHDSSLLHPISGVIGLSGRAVGTVVINFSEPVALAAASTLLMSEQTELNNDVIDAVGELANVVAGSAKAALAQYEMSVSLPNVVVGERHDIRFQSNVKPIRVPFECEWGPLCLEVGLTAVAAPVEV